MFAVLACTFAVPAAVPVTGTFTVVAPGAKVTVAGTVTNEVLSDLRFTVNPAAGAGPDRFRTTLRVISPGSVTNCCAKLSVPLTKTCCVPA